MDMRTCLDVWVNEGGSIGKEPPSARRILVVEDDALIGMYLSEMLVTMGHDVCAVEATEAHAVKAAAQHKPDLMIVDAQLIDGSGVAAVDEILRHGFIPHIFVSGDILKVRALKPSAIVIQKPYRKLDLVRAISRAFDAF